jgi:hypothetical protein
MPQVTLFTRRPTEGVTYGLRQVRSDAPSTANFDAAPGLSKLRPRGAVATR